MLYVSKTLYWNRSCSEHVIVLCFFVASGQVVAASSKPDMSTVPTPNAQETWGYVDTTTDKVTIFPASPFCEAVFVSVVSP